MHAEVEMFLAEASQYVPWDGAKVIEVGAQNVNGATRDRVLGVPARWVGIDLVPGDGVDLVGDAAELLAHLARTTSGYDIAVSTEVLEHAPNWADILVGMIQVLAPGGYLVITCAAPGRPPHAASGGDMHEDEYYQNVGLADVLPIIEGHGLQLLYAVETSSFPQDLRLVAKAL